MAWIFWAGAFFEGIKKLLRRTIRELVRPANEDWKKLEDDLLKLIVRLNQELSKLRDPLAHGGFGTEGLSSQRVWEAGLVLDIVPPAFPQFWQVAAEYRDTLHGDLYIATKLIFDVTEKTFLKVNSYLGFHV